jgi:predicted RNA-binding Zn-ribbon protein involved in translation (DUF1610 family)
MTAYETYKMTCWSCNTDLELPCDQSSKCPHCGAGLVIDWQAARQDVSDDAPQSRVGSADQFELDQAASGAT